MRLCLLSNLVLKGNHRVALLDMLRVGGIEPIGARYRAGSAKRGYQKGGRAAHQDQSTAWRRIRLGSTRQHRLNSEWRPRQTPGRIIGNRNRNSGLGAERTPGVSDSIRPYGPSGRQIVSVSYGTRNMSSRALSILDALAVSSCCTAMFSTRRYRARVGKGEYHAVPQGTSFLNSKERCST